MPAPAFRDLPHTPQLDTSLGGSSERTGNAMPGSICFKVDPLLKNITADPRYRAFLRKMDLPECPFSSTRPAVAK
jgi:hypothetical protein